MPATDSDLRTPDGADHALRVSPHAEGSFDLKIEGNSTSVARSGDAVGLDGVTWSSAWCG